MVMPLPVDVSPAVPGSSVPVVPGSSVPVVAGRLQERRKRIKVNVGLC